MLLRSLLATRIGAPATQGNCVAEEIVERNQLMWTDQFLHL